MVVFRYLSQSVAVSKFQLSIYFCYPGKGSQDHIKSDL